MPVILQKCLPGVVGDFISHFGLPVQLIDLAVVGYRMILSKTINQETEIIHAQIGCRGAWCSHGLWGDDVDAGVGVVGQRQMTFHRTHTVRRETRFLSLFAIQFTLIAVGFCPMFFAQRMGFAVLFHRAGVVASFRLVLAQ